MEKVFCLQDFHTESALTLGEILQLGSLGGVKLLAGQSGLQNVVARANVVETSDLAAWSDSGDLILSSGYAFRSSEDALVKQIVELSHQNVAGLCLKPARSDQGLREKAIQQAEQLGFPLLELPVTAIFSNIVQESMEEILSKRVMVFQEIQSTTESLLNAMWKESTPEYALEIIENAFHNPILIFDQENDLIITAKSRKLLGDTVHDDLIRQLYKQQPQDSFSFQMNHIQKTVPVYFLDKSHTSEIQILVLEFYGRLRSMDQVILQQISRSLILSMKNALTIKKVRRKYKRQFVNDLLLGQLGDDIVNICVSAHSDGYELNMSSSYRVIVMNLHVNQNSSNFSEKDVSIIRHIIRNLDSSILFNIQQGKLVLIMENTPDWNNMLNRLFLLAKKLNYVMNKGEMSFCISSPCLLSSINEGYAQAIKISKISERCNLQEQVITYDKLGVLYLLSMLPENSAVSEYRDKFLQPLKNYDSKHNSNLLETLKTYLNSNCNKQETALMMHTHYNTTVYRISHIEELLGVSLTDAEQQLQLRIAYKLDLLLSSKPLPLSEKEII